ncbi:hypothetical protein ACPD9D_18040, partial [Acinetobacter baumannii]|uniref:hypothetical protein n=1 Tax=Acinetobacter baumannii TaxID=470 RepID=UPI0022776AFE
IRLNVGFLILAASDVFCCAYFQSAFKGSGTPIFPSTFKGRGTPIGGYYNKLKLMGQFEWEPL